MFTKRQKVVGNLTFFCAQDRQYKVGTISWLNEQKYDTLQHTKIKQSLSPNFIMNSVGKLHSVVMLELQSISSFYISTLYLLLSHFLLFSSSIKWMINPHYLG